jgi:hypothetical protein
MMSSRSAPASSSDRILANSSTTSLVSRPGIAVLEHLIVVLILEAHCLLRIIGDPLGKENHAVNPP